MIQAEQAPLKQTRPSLHPTSLTAQPSGPSLFHIFSVCRKDCRCVVLRVQLLWEIRDHIWPEPQKAAPTQSLTALLEMNTCALSSSLAPGNLLPPGNAHTVMMLWFTELSPKDFLHQKAAHADHTSSSYLLLHADPSQLGKIWQLSWSGNFQRQECRRRVLNLYHYAKHTEIWRNS